MEPTTGNGNMFNEPIKRPPTLTSMINGLLPNDIRNDQLAHAEFQLKVDHFVEEINLAQEHASFTSNRRLIDLLCTCINSYTNSITISRNDKELGFWHGPESDKYLRALEARGKNSIKQVRLMVYDGQRKFSDEAGSSLVARLKACHQQGSLYQIDATTIDNFSLTWLKMCAFGLTLFWNEGKEDDSSICIAAVPSDPHHFTMVDLSLLPSTLVDLRPWHFPLRAFLIRDRRHILDIWNEVKYLLERIKDNPDNQI
jgi:hypothetical protein